MYRNVQMQNVDALHKHMCGCDTKNPHTYMQTATTQQPHKRSSLQGRDSAYWINN